MATGQSLDDKVREGLSRPVSRVDITTTGRKSGQPRRIEMVLHNIDGKLYISGQPYPKRRGWLSNLEAHPQFTLHLTRGVRADPPASAREITHLKEGRQVVEGVARHWQRHDADTMVSQSPLIEVTV